jgi:hypothetical protein
MQKIVQMITPSRLDGALIWEGPLVFSLWWRIELESLLLGDSQAIQFFNALKGISRTPPVASPQRLGHTVGVASENKVGANERQIGGNHYKTGGEEHWDRVRRLNLDYFQAQITKYTERCWRKNGLQDLQKARHFLDKYIELIEAEKDQGDIPGADGSPTAAYVDQARDKEAEFRARCADRPK